MTTDEQIERYKKGFSYIKLVRPAVIKDGITKYTENEVSEKIAAYDNKQKDFSILKFVPASGAATRMFKCLFEGIDELKRGEELNKYACQFLSELSNFPFYRIAKPKLESADSNQLKILETIVGQSGLNYASKPKGAIHFHFFDGKPETPIFDHLLEGDFYAKKNNRVAIHFTVSEFHKNLFIKLIEGYKKRFTNVVFDIDLSFQKSSTDVVAVDLENNPILNDGTFFMRPSGHGALLENFNSLSADMVFIKNIDNVEKPELKKKNLAYKKFLSALLIEKKDKIHKLLSELEDGNIENAQDFCSAEFGIKPADIENLKLILNRPIRVCGMVENTGEPGGGPFWVENDRGEISLQIVEKSQIDLNNPSQKQLLLSSTHFNPVDLVCWITDFRGTPFNLLNFRDTETGFISQKSYKGKVIKSIELPGLWNGSMANWNTFFVEVPLETFNPVKTVLDLLKPAHLS